MQNKFRGNSFVMEFYVAHDTANTRIHVSTTWGNKVHEWEVREDNVRLEFSAVGKATSAWIVCVCLSVCVRGEVGKRERYSFERRVGVGTTAISLVRAQALNFQIAPANKCRVDKRGKTMPTWRLEKRVGKVGKGGVLTDTGKKRKESHAVKTGAIITRKWCRHT